MRIGARLRIARSLGFNGDFSLNIGCGESPFADINLDINHNVGPDIVADARKLPFKANVFGSIYFTDVIEHLPKGCEGYALCEIARVIKNEGKLILSCPNDTKFFTWFDPMKLVGNHTHYSMEKIGRLLERHDFKVETMFTSGNIWNWVNTIWGLIAYVPKKFGILIRFQKVIRLAENAYYDRKTNGGVIIFIRAIKRKSIA